MLFSLLMDYLVHDFTDDLTVFTVAQETLEKPMHEDSERREQEIAPTTAELVRKEEAEIAHYTALAEIKRRATRRTPGFVREFLYHWWTKTQVDAYMKNREGDDSWTHRLGVVDALAWSVAPLKTGEIQLPHFDVPEGFTPQSYLRHLTEAGLAKRFGTDITKEQTVRMDYELGIIEKTGYASNFLIVQDFVNWAKQQGIVVGPGRGSAAGSFV